MLLEENGLLTLAENCPPLANTHKTQAKESCVLSEDISFLDVKSIQNGFTLVFLWSWRQHIFVIVQEKDIMMA